VFLDLFAQRSLRVCARRFWGKKAAASAFTAAQVLFVPATVCKTSARRRGHRDQRTTFGAGKYIFAHGKVLLVLVWYIFATVTSA